MSSPAEIPSQSPQEVTPTTSDSTPSRRKFNRRAFGKKVVSVAIDTAFYGGLVLAGFQAGRYYNAFEIARLNASRTKDFSSNSPTPIEPPSRATPTLPPDPELLQRFQELFINIESLNKSPDPEKNAALQEIQAAMKTQLLADHASTSVSSKGRATSRRFVVIDTPNYNQLIALSATLYGDISTESDPSISNFARAIILDYQRDKELEITLANRPTHSYTGSVDSLGENRGLFMIEQGAISDHLVNGPEPSIDELNTIVEALKRGKVSLPLTTGARYFLEKRYNSPSKNIPIVPPDYFNAPLRTI